MGAWGPGSLQNDDALDYLAELDSVEDALDLLNSAFDLSPDYIENPDASRALAAAFIIACLKDGNETDLLENKSILAKLPRSLANDFCMPAKLAVEKILQSSETQELWEAASREDFTKWQNNLQNLIARLA